jgi:ABC-type sugar transport system substrate-binding protein
MKKILTLFLLIGLALTLFACKTSDTGADSSASPGASSLPAGSVPPDASPEASSAPAYIPGYTKIGWYDPAGDYYNRDPYRIVYITYQCGSFGALMSTNFAGWASVTNVDYSTVDAADMDKFYNLVETYAGQGVDGFILDGDPSTGDRTVELTNELGVTAWTTATSALRNPDGSMLWIGVTMDSTASGRTQADWLWTHYKDYFTGDYDINDIGYIHCGYSVVPNLQQVEDGVIDYLSSTDFNMDNYFPADASGQSWEAEVAYNLVSTVISSHSDITYWLVSTCCEPFGAGAASAVETAGKTNETAIVISQDGNTLFSQWDSGYDGCWVGALTCPMEFFTEPIMLGVIAMIDGLATPETIWPEYKTDGEKYANVIVDNTMLTADNYKQFLTELKERAPFNTQG